MRRWMLGPMLVTLSVAVPADAQRTVELPSRDAALRSRPAEVWKVGTDEGESWEMLSDVASLAFDARDNLYALDRGNHRVLVFDANGKFVRSLGKQGGGPGEFQAPVALTILRNGQLAVLDLGRRGFVVFAPDGSYVHDIQLPEELGMPRGTELYAHPGGGILARAMPALRLTPGSPMPPSGGEQKSPVFRMNLADPPSPVTLHEFTIAAPTVRQGEASGGRRTVMAFFSVATFEKQPSFAMGPDGGAVISESEDYSLLVTDPAGRPLRKLTRPFSPRKVTDRDREAAREQRRKQLKEGGRSGQVFVTSGAVFRSAGSGGGGAELTDEQIEQQLQAMTFADEIAAIERIWSDPTGRLWVQRRPERVGGDSPIDLIASGDRYIGTITGTDIPGAVSASGLAAWIERDQYDIEQIVVRRLPADWK